MAQRINSEATHQQYSGQRSQLCKNCIRDEMEIYWKRQGTAPPVPPQAGATIALVAQWPTAPGSLQDLCICHREAVVPFILHCHACRNAAFQTSCNFSATQTEDFLRENTGPVLTGRKLCTRNGGTIAHRVQARHQAARMAAGIGCMCLCGGRPKVWEGPGLEYITFCLTCSGVRIVPANLPPQYSQATIQGRRRSPRRGLARTKGPGRAVRSEIFRVNIEKGWSVPYDVHIGGT